MTNARASNIAFNQPLQRPTNDTKTDIERLAFRILGEARSAEIGVEIYATTARAALFGLVSTASVVIDKWKSSDTAAALHFPLARLPTNFGAILRRKSFDGFTTSTIHTTQLCAHGWLSANTAEVTRAPHLSYIIRVDPQLRYGNDAMGPIGAESRRGATIDGEIPSRLLQCLAIGEKLKPALRQYDRSASQVEVESKKCEGPDEHNCATKRSEKRSTEGAKILSGWAMPSEIRRWNDGVEKGATANLKVKSNPIKVNLQTMPNTLWVRSVWDEGRAVNLSGAAVQTQQRAAGAVFCGNAPLPITQISNVKNERANAIDIVLAYASAFALIFVQLRVGVGNSLSATRRMRTRARRDIRMDGLHQLLRSEFLTADHFQRSGKMLTVISQNAGRARLVAQSICMILIGVAELIPVWLVYHIENRARNWTGIAARVCSSSMGWESSSLKLENPLPGIVPVDGFATSTIIKTTTFIHSQHMATKLLIGAIVISVIAGAVTFAEIFYVWSNHLTKEYDSESDDLIALAE